MGFIEDATVSQDAHAYVSVCTCACVCACPACRAHACSVAHRAEDAAVSQDGTQAATHASEQDNRRCSPEPLVEMPPPARSPSLPDPDKTSERDSHSYSQSDRG